MGKSGFFPGSGRGLLFTLLALLWFLLPVQAGEERGHGVVMAPLAEHSDALFAGVKKVYYGPYYQCDRCRTRCYRGWRGRCGSSRFCRRGFVRCMRYCWYSYCRY